ncbi:glycosyltransferase family 2 protein [Gelidibacter sp. DF109]|uniref:Glycosyltransferase family 2 protein n=2 Tax=Gelidibacter pelagius TaxID=2819985 RepID=A0ABS3SW13_9FLAO|nr:glycosyltransferase family 2 protein [Gelidibacter pelagius]MBO3099915.1 glycosyltransferase family 2 protein [Gelidibacter pelagius]
MMVSIIMPTYNRAHLITETLDSIIAQSYIHWECLVIDDGSSDNTMVVINKYTNRDSRIKLFCRPESKPKGANACRNIGLEKAQGNYVVFFDSDDLMTENHLEVKVHAMQKYNCDYVITRTEYFNHTSEKLRNYYNFEDFKISKYNYIAQNINWLTLDICIKRDLATRIRFNEALQSGQEYNYFSILVHHSTHAYFIDKVVSLRLYHTDSIRGRIDNEQKLLSGAFKSKWLTYLDLKEITEKEIRVLLLEKCLFYMAKGRNMGYAPKKIDFIKALFSELHVKAIYFFPMWLSFKVSEDKGYFFYKKLIGHSV